MEIKDRIFLFLTRMRRRFTFETLERLFGVAHGSVQNYYDEILDLFCNNLVPRLVFPLSKDEIVIMTPEDFRKDLPGILVIWDATGFKLKSKESVLLGRLLYSAYHHVPEGFAVFGK